MSKRKRTASKSRPGEHAENHAGAVYRAAGYTRVSSDLQVRPDGSLVNQAQQIREFVAHRQRLGHSIELVETYTDEGISGRTVERPEFQRMLAAFDDDRINTIIITEYSRFGRSTAEVLGLVGRITTQGGHVISIKEDLDTTTPQGRLMLTMIAGLNQFESEQLSTRVRNAYRARAERGLWNGSRLFGYMKHPTKPGHLVVDENQAAVVRQIYAEYLKTGSYAQVAHALQAEGAVIDGFTSKRGRLHPPRPLGKGTVLNVLRNPAYIGLKAINPENRFADEDDLPADKRYRTVPACWDAIIDAETWERAQALLETNGARHRNIKAPVQHNYLLTGKVLCAHCGCVLENSHGTSKSGKRYFYYRHPHGQQYRNCPIPSNLPAEQVEKIVLDRFHYLTTRPKLLQFIVARANNRVMVEREHHAAQIRRYNSEVQQCEGKITQLFDEARTASAFMRETFYEPEAKRLHDQKIKATRNENKHLRAHRELGERSYDAGDISAALSRIGDWWDKLTPDIQKRLVQALVDHVEIRPMDFKDNEPVPPVEVDALTTDDAPLALQQFRDSQFRQKYGFPDPPLENPFVTECERLVGHKLMLGCGAAELVEKLDDGFEITPENAAENLILAYDRVVADAAMYADRLKSILANESKARTTSKLLLPPAATSPPTESAESAQEAAAQSPAASSFGQVCNAEPDRSDQPGTRTRTETRLMLSIGVSADSNTVARPLVAAFDGKRPLEQLGWLPGQDSNLE